MLIQFQNYLTVQNIYLWTTFGVLPFWVMLILIPNSKFTQILVNSVILPLILSSAYAYVVYQILILDESILDLFRLYLSLDDLYSIFSVEQFLLIFWLHFLAINLFLGSWVARDGVKYNIPRKVTFLPLIIVYFSGPLGLIFYWLFRIFYAKKLGFHD
tara:strand:+ start:858 stop:1331 length:474 start_codon:yes stop_codon:yes gene_type:complete